MPGNSAGQARSENQIFSDLKNLCACSGYIHALAQICFRDNIVAFKEEMKAEDMQKIFRKDRLIRTEVTSLLGIVVQGEIDWRFPGTDLLGEYIQRTHDLMEELHFSFGQDLYDWATNRDESPAPEVSTEGTSIMREPIFYSGESAYTFQYRDFSLDKYAADDEWLLDNKGFDTKSAVELVRAIASLQNDSLTVVANSLEGEQSLEKILQGYVIDVEKLSERSGIEKEVTSNFLSAFTLTDRNEAFDNVSDFNTVASTPLIPLPDGSLLLLQYYSIVEALYESPFYWMAQDETYATKAFRNRGLFTENFAYEKLKAVFGDKNVFANIDLYIGKKDKRTSEIDVLVTFGDRIIILQAKSKRMTLGARKGNDGLLRNDFKKAIQHSYDQGLLCAESLGNPDCILMLPDGTELNMQLTPKEILIVNLVSDHYPALSFQSSQFLQFKKTEKIKAPFVMDVFLLDAMTEMLNTPLRLLSYMRARVEHIGSFQMSHELTALSYHLKSNFWKDDETNFVMLDDDIAVDLDIAMAVRRDGVPGAHTPEGILTKFAGTKFESLISQIERKGDPVAIELGFDLLAYDESSCRGIDKGLTHIINGTANDGRCHDFSVGSIQHSSGVTFHCNVVCDDDTDNRLRAHCINRKYVSKFNKWIGVCLDKTGTFQTGLLLDFPWKRSDEMDAQTAHMRRGIDPKLTGRNGFPKIEKIGRNAKCPCGSGKKFKNCHM